MWLNAQLEWLRSVEPQADLRLLEQARALFPAIGEADGATRAVTELGRLADRAWSAEGTAMLRHYLGYALAARAVEVRRTLGLGGVVIVEGIADHILALETCDSELDDFAEGLRRGRETRDQQRPGLPAVPVFAVLLVVFGVVPVVAGALVGSTALMGVGGLFAVVLAVVLAWLLRSTRAHRRPAHLASSVSRAGR